MFKPLLGLFVAASATGAAFAQPDSQGRWTLEVASTGCVVHTASPSGTVVSIFGIAGQDSLSFLVQNKRWGSFADGEKYDIQVGFDGQRAWPMQAVARQNIDSDGPGLTFAVSPARDSRGASFVEQFAGAQGMHITRNGARIETISLADTQVAMQGLAKCLSQVWAGGAKGDDEGSSVQLSADARSI